MLKMSCFKEWILQPFISDWCDLSAPLWRKTLFYPACLMKVTFIIVMLFEVLLQKIQLWPVPLPSFSILMNCLSADTVSWCYEPSLPQQIISGLSTKFNPSPSYSFLKTLYHKSLFLKSLSKSSNKKPTQHTYIWKNTPISLKKTKLYPQFWNTNPEKQ